MLSAIVFDFDGTLVRSIESIYEQCVKIAVKLDLPERSYEEFSVHVGKTWRDVLRGTWGDIDVEAFNELYDFRDETAEEIPGVFEAVRKLSESYRVFLLTSRGGKTMNFLMDQVDFPRDLFEAVYHKSVLDYLKPDPRVFDKFMAESGLAKSDFIYIGDALVDAEATSGAGVGFVGVLTGAAKRTDFEDLGLNCIDSVSLLPEYLSKSL